MRGALQLVKWVIVGVLLFSGTALVLSGMGIDLAPTVQRWFPGADSLLRSANFLVSLLAGSRLEGHALGVGIFLLACALLASFYRVG
jgi:hypothetical protein